MILGKYGLKLILFYMGILNSDLFGEEYSLTNEFPFPKIHIYCWMWWFIPVIPALGK
jgi:hypothetical protein